MKRRVLRKITAISVTNNDFSISDKFADTPFEMRIQEFYNGDKGICKSR
jgi:hypothetical protein